MELQDSVKSLRRELGMTQAELANALHLSSMTVTRWETGRTVPQPKAIRAILKLAKQKGASARCIQWLDETLRNGHKEVLRVSSSELFPVERESICQLVDDSLNAIYVVDMETDELLYVNHKAEEYVGKPHADKGEKCYSYLYGREKPCEGCPKTLMKADEGTAGHVVSSLTGRRYNIKGRKLTWNGRPAHVQYFYDETSLLEGQGGMAELVETLPVGVCTCYVYEDGRIYMKYMNAGYFKIMDSDRDKRAAYGGYGVMNAICPEDRERVEAAAKEAARAERDMVITYRAMRDDGTAKALRMRAAFVRKEDDRAVYHCVLCAADDET